ncbi:MAG: ABC transporter ATP-binding protein [Halanaerobiales bacterium]
MSYHIQAENLVYHYDDIKAVKGISFKVEEGEVLGFLGPNGAGKSTTIKMMTGQLIPKSGRVSVFGKDVTKNPLEVKKSIGVCFEQPNHYEQLTAKENLIFFARLFGMKGFEPERLLERVGLGDRMDDKVSKYSKGMKQRLMLARTLLNNPRVLFLDEPASGLDPVSAEAIRNIILEEKKKGVTILLTTHDMTEADKLSDRVAFINKGEIEVLDTPYNLKLKYGKKIVFVDVKNDQGGKETIEIPMGNENTGDNLKEVFENKEVLTVHSREATLEDIFIRITGRGLAG